MFDLKMNELDSSCSEFLSLTEICTLCGISELEANELVDYGAIIFDYYIEGKGMLSKVLVPPLVTACAIRQLYDMDLFMVVITSSHLRRISELELSLNKYLEQAH